MIAIRVITIIWNNLKLKTKEEPMLKIIRSSPMEES